MSSDETSNSQQPHSDQAPGRNGGIEESGNVDRIRDILFGSQMRDYDSRFQRLEERLAREASELRVDLQKRITELESFIRSEVESLIGRLKTEQAERLHAFERIGRELGDTAKGLEFRINHVDEQAAKESREVRQQLRDHLKALGAEIKEQHDQIKAGLESEARQIRGAMTGRESLAEMLSEVALRLKGEFRVPGAS
ncbi:MAG: hypothetical protein V4710_13235 [Verrucomicrobiota bacterium]